MNIKKVVEFRNRNTKEHEERIQVERERAVRVAENVHRIKIQERAAK